MNKKERDELAATILRHPWLPDHDGLYAGLCPECPERKIAGGHNSPSHADHLADAILAAGYRKPRTITTTEELDALPVGSVIRTARAVVYEKGCFPEEPDFAYWLVTGMNREFASTVLALPATVIHEGAQS